VRARAKRFLVAIRVERPLRWARDRVRSTSIASRVRFRGARAKDYDAQTEAVLLRVLHRDSNCVDVGCHRGSILDMMLRRAPDGHHIGVEPLPELAARLRTKYADRRNVEIREVALGSEAGTTTFQHVVTNSAYSGLRRRDYPREEEVRELTVQLARLDDLVPAARRVTIIKIDVEGGELGVLRGATGILRRDRPFVVFEHGLGAAEFYGTTPDTVWDLFAGCGLNVSLMVDWLAGRPVLDRAAFVEEFDLRRNFYFLAHA
jgi:FkbM family methyltransferase